MVGAQAAQFLAPQPRVVAEGEHSAVANRLVPSHLQDRAPVRLVRDPGQPGLARDQTSPVAATCADVRRVAAAADRVRVAQAILDQVVVEQPDGRQSLLHRGVRQTRTHGTANSASVS